VSEVGQCGDNAAAEGFLEMIKRERIYRRRYLSLTGARPGVFGCTSVSTLFVCNKDLVGTTNYLPTQVERPSKRLEP